MLPPLLRELIQRRARRLHPEAARVLRVACVLEGELCVALLSELCERPRADVLGSIDELMRAGIVQPSPGAPGRWRFIHELVREAFREGLELTERARLHLRAGVVFQARARQGGGFPLVLAAHHLRGALPLSEPAEVVEACRAAARWKAARGACLEATRLEQQAFELAEQNGLGSERDRLAQVLRLGRRSLAAGLAGESSSAYAQAIERARASQRPRLLVEAVLGHGAALAWGRHPNPIADRLPAEALLLVAHDSPLRARLLARRALSRCQRGITPVEIEMAPEAVRIAGQHRTGRDRRAWLEANRALHFALQGPSHLQERDDLAPRSRPTGCERRSRANV